MRPAEELRYLILAAQREGNRMLAQALKPLGVTPSQAEVVRLLQDRQPLTLSSLGDLLVCESGNSPSRLVDRMVSAGLVQREVPEHDRRQVELSLTEAGLAVARQVAAIEEELYVSIDAAGGKYDLAQVTGFLWDFIGRRPAGEALARRTGG